MITGVFETMKMKTLSEPFRKVWIFLCVFFAFEFIFYCFYQYFRYEDASLIHFNKYHEDEDKIYPSLTICLADYLDRKAFGNSRSLMEDYKQFLRGKKWNEYLANIDYENVTIDIKKYIVESYVTTLNKKIASDKEKLGNLDDEDDSILNNGYDMKDETSRPSISVIDDIDPGHKCWTFQIPFIKDQRILTHGLALRKDIF